MSEESREAAKECSPGRKPWVISYAANQPRRGERKKLHLRHRLTKYNTTESTTLNTTEVASGK
ncbi:MAG: hypothetical protein WCD01_02020 [Candidatus Sulfotelmatobacter sp.]